MLWRMEREEAGHTGHVGMVLAVRGVIEEDLQEVRGRSKWRPGGEGWQEQASV